MHVIKAHLYLFLALIFTMNCANEGEVHADLKLQEDLERIDLNAEARIQRYLTEYNSSLETDEISLYDSSTDITYRSKGAGFNLENLENWLGELTSFSADFDYTEDDMSSASQLMVHLELALIASSDAETFSDQRDQLRQHYTTFTDCVTTTETSECLSTLIEETQGSESGSESE